MIGRRRLGPAALAVAASVVAIGSGHHVARADTANRECDNDRDITVVIDFHELIPGDDNDVNVRCAPQPVDTGFNALRRADISFEVAKRGPFICRIAGLPDAEHEACQNYPPANAYWVYWYADRGGDWVYSEYGAGTRTPPPGSIEGWSFAKDRDSAHLPPPRYPVPKPIPGSAPPPTEPSSSVPPTTSAPASGIVTTTTRLARAPSATTSTTSATSPTTFVEFQGTIPPTSVALGHFDLSTDHTSHGTPWGFVVGIGAVAAAGAAGLTLARLRRRGPASREVDR